MPSDWQPDNYVRAWDFATWAHEGQSYGGPQMGERIPYVNHIGAVAMEVLWALQFPPVLRGDLALQCALLHDTLEDTAVTFDQLQTLFGPEVAAGVQALTKDSRLATKTARMADSLRRIQQQPVEIWLVKMADRITNLSEPPFDWDAARRRAYQEEARQIYRSLHPAHPTIAGRLLEKIEAYTAFI